MSFATGDPLFPPQGVFRQPDGGVLWRVWAPLAEEVLLVTWPGGERRVVPMVREELGYFTYRRNSDVAPGLRYAYQLGHDKPERPDPATRWQPDGLHTPSAVFFPEDFAWRSPRFAGVPRDQLVIYELHVGTFTPEGTFDAVIPRLPELRDLGITAIEIMPVAQFPGERNWGYDGVHPYAAQNTYGGPEGLLRLVDACHELGLAALLDVVYNHFGPEGNYLGEFGPYFTSRYHTPWGAAINYDGEQSGPVRRFVIDNACMWIRDFRFDGLRLDAVQTIYDFGARHLLAELQEAVQTIAREQGRKVHVIAETNQNDVRLISPAEAGGYGLDGVWSDDFHHAVHAVLSGERQGYFEDFGDPAQIAKAYNDVFVFDGEYSPYHRRRVGSRTGDLDRGAFVVCLKNHDQVGNRAQGDRPSHFLSKSQQKLACGLLMLSPCVPLIFMGEEYGERNPFPFFCSFGDEGLIEAVRQGRRREFAELKFRWDVEIPDPHAPETFNSATLSWSWPSGGFGAQLRQLYQDLLKARREWPALRDRTRTRAQLASKDGGEQVLVIHRGADPELAACANFSSAARPVPREVAGCGDLLISTEFNKYGGNRKSSGSVGELLPHELLIFGPREWMS